MSLRDLIERAKQEDTLQPAEVVRLASNPPQDPNEPRFQEAVQTLARWWSLGSDLASAGLYAAPEDLVVERFPGIDRAKDWREQHREWIEARERAVQTRSFASKMPLS